MKALFDKHPGRIAAVILEAARAEEPRDNFLHKVRDLCHSRGALFILDEMITGFRWDTGGAQRHYGIEPDLSSFGKALANGFSVSALAGQREFMRLGGLDHVDRPRVFLLSTTHGAETHALAAAIATMRVYQNEPVIEHLKRQGQRLKRRGRKHHPPAWAAGLRRALRASLLSALRRRAIATSNPRRHCARYSCRRRYGEA